ncbi:MAG: hypothetical protein JF588_11695 [Caulobacterales bacterium]|nr:hypothetical protein [Caulobacterales bacterium]
MATFTGTSGDDTFTGDAGFDNASGGPGNDSLSGGGGGDNLAGGAGRDTLDGGSGDDTLFSGDRSPTFNLPYAGNPYTLPVVDTGSEVDNLTGGDGSDRIFAGYGDNVDGGPDGSFGDYLFISFQGAPSGVTADFGLASQTIGGGVITGIENVSYIQGSQFADNITARSTGVGYSDFTAVLGMGGNDTLTAGYYTGTLFGGDGDDLVDGRPSQYLDLVDGGAGNDTLYTNTNTFATADGGAGNDTIYAHGVTRGGAGNDTIAMQQTYYAGQVSGDDGDDKITAAASGNRIAGGAGADTITGDSADDFLFSGSFSADGVNPADDAGLEHDKLSGGGGNDVLAIGYGDDADGGAGTDTLRLSLAGLPQGADFDLSNLISAGSASFGGGVIQNMERLAYLGGTAFADSLRLPTQSGVTITVNAGAGNDVITAQGSAASVLGGDGDDRLVSGSGADTFDGGAGRDTIDYSAATAGVAVNLKTGVGGGGDALVSVEVAIGSAFNDTLTGGGTGASLSGGTGDDRLETGARDVATLGAGADLVYVSSASHSAAALSSVVTVTDWTSADHLQFGATTGGYFETTASGFLDAVHTAEVEEAAGYNFVAVQVGGDVFVFGEAISQRLHFDAAVRLVGATLDSVSASNVGLPGALEPALPPPLPPAAIVEPTLPAAPSAGVGGANGTISGDMDHAHLAPALDAIITAATTTFFTATIGDVSLRADGFGFSTDGAGHLNGGTATSIAYSYGASHGGPFGMSLAIPQTPMDSLAYWLATDGTQAMFGSVLSGADRIVGGAGGDLLRAFSGADLMYGGGGADTLWGGIGNDVIYAAGAPGAASGAAGATYLRGEDGDDYIIGGTAFDDINGNQGNDTASGGPGDDWVVGGKDNDLLFGDGGGDLVYGNIGADTCVGGEGADIVRGGQDNDLVFGGAGDDFVSGDKGDDTMVGGAGADIFHTFGDAGLDRVTDFSAADGDRVMLDPGTRYTLDQVGSDIVINMVGGGQMILLGVQLSALPTGWIFGA